jgi:hypothetical protein
VNLAALGQVIVMMALAVAFSSGSAQAKDKEPFERIYAYTYEEVFQAAQEAAERQGWSVTSADKDRGVILGGGVPGCSKCTFEVHIEIVSPKPETRVTFQFEHCCNWDRRYRQGQSDGYLGDIQKVLVTYK